MKMSGGRIYLLSLLALILIVAVGAMVNPYWFHIVMQTVGAFFT